MVVSVMETLLFLHLKKWLLKFLSFFITFEHYRFPQK